MDARRRWTGLWTPSSPRGSAGSFERGWIRLTGLAPLMLWLACLMVVRNQRTLHAFQVRLAYARTCRCADERIWELRWWAR